MSEIGEFVSVLEAGTVTAGFLAGATFLHGLFNTNFSQVWREYKKGNEEREAMRTRSISGIREETKAKSVYHDALVEWQMENGVVQTRKDGAGSRRPLTRI